MSQEEIIRLLQDDKPRSCKEIAEELELGRPTVWKQLMRLILRDEIERKEIKREGKWTSKDDSLVLYQIKKFDEQKLSH